MKNMKAIFAAFFAATVFAGVAAAQGQPNATTPSAHDGGFQVRYFSNLVIADSVINITNDGASTTAGGHGLDALANNFQQFGQLCANLYVYSVDEQLVSCCSCNVTPNGLVSLSVRGDLVSNLLTPAFPIAAIVKIVTTEGGSRCTASSAAVQGQTRAGLLAWGTAVHQMPVTPGTPAGTYGLTETPFSMGQFNPDEYRRMTDLCAFIRSNGSGYGICKSCKIGGLGSVVK